MTPAHEPATLDRLACYRALRTRDARFDGRFITAVTSTGIYCRPICPARPPRLEHCIFLPSAAAAQTLGYRACLRCRPELAPSSPVASGTQATVSRALGLIGEGALNVGGVEALAERLGVGDRHLRRLFDAHVGASPVAVAQAHRVHFAKRLLTDSSLSLTQVALASGFGSVRRFNHAMRQAFGRPPSQLRRVRSLPQTDGTMLLSLSYRPPFAWSTLLSFFAQRALPGIEWVDGDVFHRTFVRGDIHGQVAVEHDARRHCVRANIAISDVSALAWVVSRLRRVLDLDADMAGIDAQLARDARLRRRIEDLPGVRVPGAWDPFELVVRAVLGQQVSVPAATTLASRLVDACARGGPALPPGVRVFPSPAAILALPPTGLGLTNARWRTLQAVARAVLDDPSLLESTQTEEQAFARWTALPGIGPWTARYIAMRALHDPDAFPSGDLALQRALSRRGVRPTAAELSARAQAWRPFRAYAALRLWSQ